MSSVSRRPALIVSCALALCHLAACDGSTPATDGGPLADSGPPDAGPVDCTTRSADAPETRGEVSGVLDSARGRILVFGGNTGVPTFCGGVGADLKQELWAFELDCQSWRQITSEGAPSPRGRHSAVLDSTRDRMLIFGGRFRPDPADGDYMYYNDLWALNLADDTWSSVETSGSAPPPRGDAIVVYDEARERLLVFGGNNSVNGIRITGLSDLFALDLQSGVWSEISAAGSPAPRALHGGVIVGDDLIIHGGFEGDVAFGGSYTNDTFAFNLVANAWREIEQPLGTFAPAARFGPQLFADSARGRAILAFGHDDTAMGNRNDMWALNISTGEWSELQVGDVLDNENSDFCDFPADFTAPQADAPERRYSLLATQSATEGFVFGGKTDCGNINDVWSFGLENGAWQLLRPPTGGEACNRSGRVDCTSLCF